VRPRFGGVVFASVPEVPGDGHADDGRSKSEAIRMLKRYVAREVYRYLPRV